MGEFVHCCQRLLPLLLLPLAAHAQTTPATQPSSPTASELAIQLADPATHESALQKASSLPPAALPALWEPAEDPATPAPVQSDLKTAIAAICARERANRFAQDLADAKQWRQKTGLDLLLKHAAEPASATALAKIFAEWDPATRAPLFGDSASFDRARRLKPLLQSIDDPFLRYATLVSELDGSITADHVRQALKLADAFESSNYPPGRKMFTFLTCVEAANRITPAVLTLARRRELLDKALACFPAYLAEHPGSTAVAGTMQRFFVAAQFERDPVFPSPRAFDIVLPTFSKSLDDAPLLTHFRCAFYYQWSQFYNEVPDDNRETHPADCFRILREIAEPGWRIDPVDPACAVAMLRVCAFQKLDRATMETWFDRAFQADPHNFDACDAKLHYLQPRGFGDDAPDDPALVFGRFCAQHGDWKDRLPRILLDAHGHRSAYTSNQDTYYLTPGVWPDLQLAYEALLADPAREKLDNSATYIDRADYLRSACRSQQWQDALKLLDRFGNHYAPAGWVFGHSYDENRAAIQERANATAN